MTESYQAPNELLPRHFSLAPPTTARYYRTMAIRRALLIAVAFATPSAAYLAPGSACSVPSSRSRPAVMKGKGSRGMPGKAVRPPAGSGMNKASKRRMQDRELEKDEWTLVATKGELGEEFASTMAVEAGQSPQGGNYIWTLIRGEAGAGQFTDDVFSNVYATDGSCRACTFPMTKATIEKEAEGVTMLCPACGTKWNLDDGSVMKWLPGEGPAQFITQQLNKGKEQMDAGLLKTRTAQSGRIYVRLPDGTLKMTKTAEDRAAELASFGNKE